MKDTAAEYARDGITPTQLQAEAVVAHLMRAERIDPWPDTDVIEFYARELIALTNEAADKADPV